jgi:hypothetical protein
MAFIHGKSVFISVSGDDLSTYTNSVEIKREADAHDVTCFGQTAKKYQSGLTDGTVTLKGTYDDGAAGPAAILMPLIGGTVEEVVYRPEGTGSTKPHYTFDAIVTSYEESAPVAEMITWTAELQISEAVAIAAQA